MNPSHAFARAPPVHKATGGHAFQKRAMKSHRSSIVGICRDIPDRCIRGMSYIRSGTITEQEKEDTEHKSRTLLFSCRTGVLFPVVWHGAVVREVFTFRKAIIEIVRIDKLQVVAGTLVKMYLRFTDHCIWRFSRQTLAAAEKI